MMVIEKLKFWKRKNEDLDSLGGQESEELNSENSEDYSMPKFERKPPKFAEPFIKNQEIENIEDKDLKLVLERLDTIKAMLENLSHRLEKIERLAEK